MLIFIIIAFGILSRVAFHIPNFTPVLSLALLGGAYLKGRQAIWVPLVLMVISDVMIGFHDSMVFTWGAILGISLLGFWLKDHKHWVNVILTSLIAAIFFFLVTNYGAFLSLYPHTTAGLKECYTLAIPFFRSTLVSTMAYSLVLYVIFEKIANNIAVRETSVSATGGSTSG